MFDKVFDSVSIINCPKSRRASHKVIRLSLCFVDGCLVLVFASTMTLRTTDEPSQRVYVYCKTVRFFVLIFVFWRNVKFLLVRDVESAHVVRCITVEMKVRRSWSCGHLGNWLVHRSFWYYEPTARKWLPLVSRAQNIPPPMFVKSSNFPDQIREAGKQKVVNFHEESTGLFVSFYFRVSTNFIANAIGLLTWKLQREVRTRNFHRKRTSGPSCTLWQNGWTADVLLSLECLLSTRSTWCPMCNSHSHLLCSLLKHSVWNLENTRKLCSQSRISSLRNMLSQEARGNLQIRSRTINKDLTIESVASSHLESHYQCRCPPAKALNKTK